MSSDESASSENEENGAQGLDPVQGHGSPSGELLSIGRQELSPFQQFDSEQSNEVVSTTAGTLAIPTLGDNMITGGKFHNTNFGPVTHHNKSTHKAKVTQIAKQEIHHHHHYGSERYDEAPDVLVLKGSINIFKKQKLHETKLIYKGEKTTAARPIPIAVKLMNYSKKALKEVESLHCLDSHLNVVKIYDSGIHYSDVEYIFMAMELCSPETLYDYVMNLSGQSPNPCQAINHSNQIISGLEYIHDRGIAHRDLKPHNILFSATGEYDQVKISDFGLSKNYQTSHTTSFTGAASGTVGYMSPELINEEKPNDLTKCDIFSLGIVVAFRLSDGKHPYGEKYFDWTPNIARGRDPNLDDIRLPNEKQADDTKRIIRKMLQHSPENRPTARALMKEWNKDVGGFIEEMSGEPQRAREVQAMSSSQRHREEFERGDICTERESGRIFLADMETRIKEVGEGESTSTTRHNRDVSGLCHTPGLFTDQGIFGIIRRKERELVYWKDIWQITSDPMVITELPGSVGGYSAVAGDRCIYLVKGMTCYRYDLDNADKGWIKPGSMKYDYGDWPAATVLNGKLYVCGMGPLGAEAFKKCEVFTGQWSELSAMKESRKGNCIVSLGGFLYSIGGLDEKGNTLQSVEKHDPSTNTWEIIQPMNIARYSAEAVVYNEKIYVWGGRNDGEWIASCECFDPSISIWTLSTSDWWKTKNPCSPFVFGNKILSLLWSGSWRYRTIQQVPLNNESEADLVKVELPERWCLCRILALK